MSYTPNNGNVYCAAFAGALAGIVASNRQLLSNTSTTYDTFCTVAQAWAQEFDTQWGMVSINALIVETIEEASEGVWNGVSVSGQTPFNAPLSYTKLVAAVIAMIDSASNNFATEGIVPPDWNTGSGTPANALSINTYASLLTTAGGTITSVIMNGYHTPGDGGGGTFAWVSTMTIADGVLTVLPTGSLMGGWQRVAQGPINVKWAGAYGDGSHDDTTAIQLAINVAQNAPAGATRIVFLPHGQYNVTAPPSGAALVVTRNIQILGESLNGSSINVTGPGPGVLSAGLLVESGFDGHTVANSVFQNFAISGSGTSVLDLIVLHGPQCSFTNISLSNCARYGMLVESGFTPLLGVQVVANGTYIDSDQWSTDGIYGGACPLFTGFITTTTADYVQPGIGGSVNVSVVASVNINSPIVVNATPGGGGGAYTGGVVDALTINITNLGNNHAPSPGTTIHAGATIQCGCLFYIHGSDSQSGKGKLISAVDCNCNLYASGLGTNLYEACYSQDSNIGYICASGTSDTFINCGTEDIDSLAVVGGVPLFIGAVLSTVAGELNTQLSTEGIGNFGSLSFLRNGTDGAQYIAQIPGTPFVLANIMLGRIDEVTTKQSVYYHLYTTSGFPFQIGSFLWKHFLNGVLDKDPIGGPFGWTDPANAQGAGLAIIGAPTMNSQRRWTFEQTGLSLSSGLNTIYCNGGAVDGGAFPFADDGTEYWANCKTRVTASVKFDTVAHMVSSGGVDVVGTCTIAKAAHGQNFAILIDAVNAVASGVTIVWEIEQYLQNYASGGSNIG